jgi:hypothetical protein
MRAAPTGKSGRRRGLGRDCDAGEREDPLEGASVAVCGQRPVVAAAQVDAAVQRRFRREGSAEYVPNPLLNLVFGLGRVMGSFALQLSYGDRLHR